MKKVDIFDEENSIMIEDQHSTTDFEFYPNEKKFTANRSIKDDCFYNKQTIEYKISTNPIEMYMRTLESSHEPPLEYSIKDGVVLESELKKDPIFFPDRLKNLKKEVEWGKVELLANPEVNLYILSKHPEIISKEDYRKFLRQSLEKIRMGVLNVKEAIKEDAHGLEICEGEYGNQIWFPTNEDTDRAKKEFIGLPAEKSAESTYGKLIGYQKNFYELLFTSDSTKYSGISEYEFENSNKLIEYLEKLLNKKDEVVLPQRSPANKAINVLIYLLTAFFIVLKLTDGVVWSWFAVISPILIWEGLGFLTAFLRGLFK